MSPASLAAQGTCCGRHQVCHTAARTPARAILSIKPMDKSGLDLRRFATPVGTDRGWRL
jgi:hypothetical protein